MATDRDLTCRGTAQDLRLKDLFNVLPTFTETDPLEIIAGLLFLDTQASLYSEENVLLVCLGYAHWLLQITEVHDIEVLALLTKVPATTDLLLLTTRPFKVSFTLPEFEYPEILKGKTMSMRLMTMEEVKELQVDVCTLTPTGDRIILPSIHTETI